MKQPMKKRLLCAQKCTRGGVGWGGRVMKGWGGVQWGRVGWVGYEGVGWGGVCHVGVGWGVSCRGRGGVGCVM